MQEPDLAAALAEVRAGRATPFQAVYSWLLARVSQSLEVMPGEEFRAALGAAQRVGAQVVLGDRPVSVTLARLAYRDQDREVAGKAMDFSPETIRQRWDAGRRDAAALLARLAAGALPIGAPGLTVVGNENQPSD